MSRNNKNINDSLTADNLKIHIMKSIRKIGEDNATEL